MTSNSRSTSPGLKDAVGSSKIIRLDVERQRLGDLDELPLRRGELPHFGSERQTDAILTEFGQDLRRRGGASA